MNVRRFTLAILVIGLAVPTELAAQVQAAVARGDRVRVTATELSSRRLVGTFHEISDTSCVLMTQDGSPLQVPLDDVSVFEVSRGRKSKAGAGALVGALVGLGAGAAVGGVAQQESQFIEVSDGMVAGIAVGTAAVGAGLGAVIGSLIKTERWERIALDQLRVEPSSIAADGVSVSLVLRH